MATPNGKGPVAQRMLAVLEDGKSHGVKELHACLEDDLGDQNNISPHLTAIRKLLREDGYDILGQRIIGKLYYRKVKLLAE